MYNTIQNPFVPPIDMMFFGERSPDMMFFGDRSPEATERLGTRTVRQNLHEDDVFQKIRDRICELYDSADEIGKDDSDSTHTVKTKTAFPKISRVVFNEPVTKVWFEDGTTSMVRASKDDTFSKEAGLAFAIVKRLYGTSDDRGNYGSAGYMMELKRIVDKAYDQTPITKKRNAEKAARSRAMEKADANSKNISNGKPGRKSGTGRKRSR